jgi:hypothetical protein
MDGQAVDTLILQQKRAPFPLRDRVPNLSSCCVMNRCKKPPLLETADMTVWRIAVLFVNNRFKIK